MGARAVEPIGTNCLLGLDVPAMPDVWASVRCGEVAVGDPMPDARTIRAFVPAHGASQTWVLNCSTHKREVRCRTLDVRCRVLS